MRPLAWQGGCGLELGTRTLSKGCPRLRQGVRGQLEDLRSQGQQWVWSDTSIGVSRTGGRVGRERRERERERKESLTQILLEQPGEHRVPVRDKIRLPLL